MSAERSSMSRVEAVCNEIPPALEGYQSKGWGEDDSRGTSSALSQTATPPSVYVSACNSGHHQPPPLSSSHHQEVQDYCYIPTRSEPQTPVSRTPLRRAPSPLEEASTPSLDAHSPIPFPDRTPRNHSEPPVVEQNYHNLTSSSSPPSSHPHHGQSSSTTMATGLRQSLHQLREKAQRLAQEVGDAVSQQQQQQSHNTLHHHQHKSPSPPSFGYDDFKSIGALASHSCVHHHPATGAATTTAADTLYAGGVHTPHQRHHCVARRASPPAASSPAPSGIELLELQYASMCRELQVLQNKMVECDQYAAKYHLHALAMERSWAEEEQRREQAQQDLVRQLLERGIPIPLLRYSADDESTHIEQTQQQ